MALPTRKELNRLWANTKTGLPTSLEAVDLTEGYSDDEGFQVKIDGDEGTLEVIYLSQTTSVVTSFRSGWNEDLIKEIVAGSSSNTATDVKVGK